MTAHDKVVSVDLTTLRRLHQFVGFLPTVQLILIIRSSTEYFLRDSVGVFEITKRDLFAILLLLLVLSEDGIYCLLLSHLRSIIGRQIGVGNPGCVDCQRRLLLLLIRH